MRFCRFVGLIIFFSSLIVEAAEVKINLVGKYEYIENEKILASAYYKHDRHGNSTAPKLYANCMVVFNGFGGGDEGRYVTYKSIEIYCGNKKTIITSEKKTNHFGAIRLNSTDNKWAVFAPVNDSWVPGYTILKSDGTIKSIKISEYLFLVKSDKDVEMEGNIAIIKGVAQNRSDGGRKLRDAAVLISPDGSFKLKYE